MSRRIVRKFSLKMIGDNDPLGSHPTYNNWKQLKLKCRKEEIEFHEEWNDSESYLKWWEDNQEDGKLLYRRDLNGPYSPKNCYFATRSEVNKRKKQAQPKPPYKGSPKDYVLPPEEKWGRLNGYVTFCDSAHPLSYDAGWVYMHMHVMSLKQGKWVDGSEHVHHIDENRSNNDPDNLKLESPEEHTRLHNERRRKNSHIRSKRNRERKPRTYRRLINCKKCGTEFKEKSKTSKYCSTGCFNQSQVKVNWPPKEELEEMVKAMPQYKIAEYLGCSDQAVYKRCKKLGIK